VLLVDEAILEWMEDRHSHGFAHVRLPYIRSFCDRP
jgi:hypothetical protein